MRPDYRIANIRALTGASAEDAEEILARIARARCVEDLPPAEFAALALGLARPGPDPLSHPGEDLDRQALILAGMAAVGVELGPAEAGALAAAIRSLVDASADEALGLVGEIPALFLGRPPADLKSFGRVIARRLANRSR